MFERVCAQRLAQGYHQALMFSWTEILCVCAVQVEGESADRPPLKFSQTFVLMPLPGGGGYWVLNDIFRLNYG